MLESNSINIIDDVSAERERSKWCSFDKFSDVFRVFDGLLLGEQWVQFQAQVHLNIDKEISSILCKHKAILFVYKVAAEVLKKS